MFFSFTRRAGVNTSLPSSWSLSSICLSLIGLSNCGALVLHWGTKAVIFLWPLFTKYWIHISIPRHEKILWFPWLKRQIKKSMIKISCSYHGRSGLTLIFLCLYKLGKYNNSTNKWIKSIYHNQEYLEHSEICYHYWYSRCFNRICMNKCP